MYVQIGISINMCFGGKLMRIHTSISLLLLPMTFNVSDRLYLSSYACKDESKEGRGGNECGRE